MPVELLFLLLLRVDGQGRRTPRQVTNVPMTPVVAPQPIRSSILPHSMEITWPRGDDAVVEPTDWFEVQRRALGEPETAWKTVENGARVGAPAMLGIEKGFREGQHEVQVLSVRVDRGEKIESGYFQLAFSFGGANYQERYTSAIYASNQTAVITRRIPFDATAEEVKASLEELETIQRVQVRRCDAAGGLGGSGGWVGGCPYGRRGGYTWEVLFEPTYYESELGVDGSFYTPDGNHGFVDEAPLSRRRYESGDPSDPHASPQSPADLKVVEVDVAANALRLGSAMPFHLEPGDKLWVGGHGVNVDGAVDGASSEPRFSNPTAVEGRGLGPVVSRDSLTARG